jgi:hypothetical protein
MFTLSQLIFNTFFLTTKSFTLDLIHPARNPEMSRFSAPPAQGELLPTVQVGGGRRAASTPPPITPTRLRSKMTPTAKDSGLIGTAAARRAQLTMAQDADGPEAQDADDIFMDSSGSCAGREAREAFAASLPRPVFKKPSQAAAPVHPTTNAITPTPFYPSPPTIAPIHLTTNAIPPTSSNPYPQTIAPIHLTTNIIPPTPSLPTGHQPYCSEAPVAEGDAGGRLSKEDSAKIQEKFSEIENLFVELAAQTDLDVATIINRWMKTRLPRAFQRFNRWNQYGSYFRVNQQDELRRVYNMDELTALTGMPTYRHC